MQNITISKKSKLFFWIFGGIFVLSLTSMYFRYVILEDYEVFLPEDLIAEIK